MHHFVKESTVRKLGLVTYNADGEVVAKKKYALASVYKIDLCVIKKETNRLAFWVQLFSF